MQGNNLVTKAKALVFEERAGLTLLLKMDFLKRFLRMHSLSNFAFLLLTPGHRNLKLHK